MKRLSSLLLLCITLSTLIKNAHAQPGWNVELVGSIAYWDYANDVAIQDYYANVTTGESGLKIVDISNPSAPF
jgi:hypothetical protein